MNSFKNIVLVTASLFTASATLSCAGGKDSEPEGGSFGDVAAALSLPPGAAHDVAQAHFVAVPLGADCNATPIAETTADIESEALIDSLDPAESPTGRAFVDGLMVLPPGEYTICVQPLQANGEVSEECAAVSGDVTVVAEQTTEIVLVSQCEGAPNGAADIVAVLNDPPVIDDLNIGPSKFITECETAQLGVVATDPNGDALSYDWEILSGPPGALLLPTGASASFTPGGPGDYELKVTVFDATGGSAELTFPIHVSASDEPCETAECPAGTFDAGGYCWVVANDFEFGSESCGRFGLEGSDQTAEGVSWTPELMAEVAAAIGCTNLGQTACCEASLYFDATTSECFTSGFSSASGSDYSNSTFSFSDTALAVHLCLRP